MIYVYPTIGITVLNAWEIPLLNTVILLSSGATITWCHHAIVVGSREDTLFGFTATIILAIIFTSLQIFEYFGAPFTISDSVYGSTFFMATGFHGFHVVIGLLGLIIILFVLCSNSNMHTLSFRAKSTSAMKKLSSRKTEFLSLHRFISLEFAFIY